MNPNPLGIFCGANTLSTSLPGSITTEHPSSPSFSDSSISDCSSSADTSKYTTARVASMSLAYWREDSTLTIHRPVSPNLRNPATQSRFREAASERTLPGSHPVVWNVGEHSWWDELFR